MRFVAVITLAILALVGGQSRAWGKVCVSEKIASGVFAAKYDSNALVDEAASLEYAGRDGRCGYELASGQSKWPSRDPIGEKGGINLYGMVRNNPVNDIDILGQDRYIFTREAHPAIYVDMYENGKRQCYLKIEFGPDVTMLTPHVPAYIILGRLANKAFGAVVGGYAGAAASVAIFHGRVYITEGVDLPFITSGGMGDRISSSEAEDKLLIDFANSLNENGGTNYYALGFNCQSFVSALANYPMKDIPDIDWNPLPVSTDGLINMFDFSHPVWTRIKKEGQWEYFQDPQGNIYKLYNSDAPIFNEWPMFGN